MAFELVQQRAQHRKQVWPTLHFVNHDGAALRQQATQRDRGFAELFQRRRVFQVKVGATMQARIFFCQGGLADLPGTE